MEKGDQRDIKYEILAIKAMADSKSKLSSGSASYNRGFLTKWLLKTACAHENRTFGSSLNYAIFGKFVQTYYD